jgi:hypothetical protein
MPLVPASFNHLLYSSLRRVNYTREGPSLDSQKTHTQVFHHESFFREIGFPCVLQLLCWFSVCIHHLRCSFRLRCLVDIGTAVGLATPIRQRPPSFAQFDGFLFACSKLNSTLRSTGNSLQALQIRLRFVLMLRILQQLAASSR